MFLADPGSDPKTAEQVLMEVLVLLEAAPEPVTSPGDRPPLVRTNVVRLPEHHEDLDEIDLTESLSEETTA